MRRNISPATQHGAAIMTIVIAILAVAAMGTAMTSMMGQTTVRQSASALGPEAQYMAESGIRYVQGQIALDVTNRDALSGRTFTLGGNAGSFSVVTAPLDLRVVGNYATGATNITLAPAAGALPSGLALANTGVRFYDAATGQVLKTEGRISQSTPRGGAVVTMEAPGLTAPLSDNDRVVSNVQPYGIWSVGTAGSGPESGARVLGMAVNTATEEWPPYIIIQGPGGTLPDLTKNIFGIGNADYGGVIHKGTKLVPENQVLDPRDNNGEIKLNIVARHGGEGWKAAIHVEGGTSNMDAGNVTGQTWYQNSPHFWVPFEFTYNTSDGNGPDNTYLVKWKLFPSYDERTQQPDFSDIVVSMSHDFGAPSNIMDRVLGNWYLTAQAPQKQQFTGTITIRKISKNNVLLPQNYVSISSTGDQYTSLVAQNRESEKFIKLTGEINLNWIGTPAQDYGMNLFFYIHDVLK